VRGLCLANSRLSRLCGVGAIISGSVDLSGVSTSEIDGEKTGADDQGLCWIELREAQIEGGLTAAEARLVAPSKRPKALLAGRRSEYALDLRAATIGTELVLSPSFTARGGVSMRSVRVDCDVSAHGAALSAVEEFALAAAGAKIGGSLLLNVQPNETLIRTAVTGGISLLGVVIEGSLDLRGATIQTLDETVASLSAKNAYIGGAALLCAYECDDKTIPCVISGELLMAGARVVGDLHVSGAQIGGLNAQNAQVGGSLFLSTWSNPKESLRFSATGNVYLAGAKIAGNLNANGASVARFSADNAQIGGAAFLGGWSKKRPVAGASDANAAVPP
jgi:hypothetical protein